MGDFGLSESSDSEGAGTSLTNQQGGSLTSKQNSSYTSVPLLDSDWSTSSEDNEVVANNRPKNNKGTKLMIMQHPFILTQPLFTGLRNLNLL